MQPVDQTSGGERTVSKKSWQLLFGGLYTALFLFLFVVKPAPEQTLRASIPISASAADVKRALNTATPIRTLALNTAIGSLAEICGLSRLMDATDDWAALALTRDEHVNITMAAQASNVLLTVETHWEVRGGLLGKALDQVVGRRAREQALTNALLRVKAEAEQIRTKQA
jgi:hypothetical protein